MEINKIYLGDALNLINDLDISPKLAIMSPPDIAETNYKLDEYKVFLNDIYKKVMQKLDNNGVLISITTDRKMDGEIYLKHVDISNTLGEYKLFNYKIWAKSLGVNLYILQYCHLMCFRKTNKITNNKIKEFYPDVLVIERDKVSGYKSKDTFPTALIDILVRNYTNEGDLVLDPFIGTGKTACVCKNLNRNYIGFELSNEYYDIANNRLIEFNTK